MANIVLPGVTYIEKDSIYVNTEGRAQNLKYKMNKKK